MGGYRQWQLTKYYNDNESKSTNRQMDRMLIILDSWERSMNENKEVIVMMDDNLD